MPISPWYIGETRPTWALTWTDDSGAAINLTGATVTVRMQALGQPGVAGAGTITVTGASTGQFTYAVAAADFPNEGQYKVQFTAVYGDGTKIMSDQLTVTVLPPS